MERLLNVVAILSGAMIVVVLASLRRAHIRVEYSVSWLTAGVTMLIVSQSAPIRDGLSRLVGIREPAMALLFIAFSVFLLVFYRFSMILSQLKDANIALAQRVAMLQYQLEAIDEERPAAETE
jgi:hypothetical protein